MKRMIAALMAALMLLLCGCGTVLPENGTLSLNANIVDHIEISNGLTGNRFTVSNRDSITQIVQHINSYTLEDPQETWNGNHYSLKFVDNDEKQILYFAINDNKVIADDAGYMVNAKDLVQYVEGLECDTMTDNELIDALLEGNTLEQLNIIDEEGKISVDKIIALPKSCPALFELLSRPSAITSVGSYGVDKIESFLNSSNPELVEKAQEWIEVLKNLLPDLQEKLESIVKS